MDLILLMLWRVIILKHVLHRIQPVKKIIYLHPSFKIRDAKFQIEPRRFIMIPTPLMIWLIILLSVIISTLTFIPLFSILFTPILYRQFLEMLLWLVKP